MYGQDWDWARDPLQMDEDGEASPGHPPGGVADHLRRSLRRLVAQGMPWEMVGQALGTDNFQQILDMLGIPNGVDIESSDGDDLDDDGMDAEDDDYEDGDEDDEDYVEGEDEEHAEDDDESLEEDDDDDIDDVGDAQEEGEEEVDGEDEFHDASDYVALGSGAVDDDNDPNDDDDDVELELAGHDDIPSDLISHDGEHSVDFDSANSGTAGVDDADFDDGGGY